MQLDRLRAGRSLRPRRQRLGHRRRARRMSRGRQLRRHSATSSAPTAIRPASSPRSRDEDGADETQASLHDIFTSFGTGVVISAGDASSTKVTGNWIGPDPGWGALRPGQRDHLDVRRLRGPRGGDRQRRRDRRRPTATPGTGARQRDQRQRPRHPRPARSRHIRPGGRSQRRGQSDRRRAPTAPRDGLGGLFGILAGNFVSGKIGGPGGRGTGSRRRSSARPRSGTPTSSSRATCSASTKNSPSLTISRLGARPRRTSASATSWGSSSADTQSVIVGGSTPAQGNQLLGNFIGAMLGGSNSADNALLNNTIGGLSAPSGNPTDFTFSDLHGLFGVINEGGGSGNDIGDPGGGNLIQGNGDRRPRGRRRRRPHPRQQPQRQPLRLFRRAGRQPPDRRPRRQPGQRVHRQPDRADPDHLGADRGGVGVRPRRR